MEAAGICSSCATPLPKSFDRTCLRCGWDNQVEMRKCVRCKGGAVTLHEPIGYGPLSGGIGIGGLILWRLMMSVLGWALIFAAGSLCGFFTMATMGYKCGACGARAPSKLLTVHEKKEGNLRRLGYLIGAVVRAVAMR